MTTPAPSPTPAKRSKRMVVWLVAVPIVILLLALAGANWKFFHLAYARRLLHSDEKGDRIALELKPAAVQGLANVRQTLDSPSPAG